MLITNIGRTFISFCSRLLLLCCGFALTYPAVADADKGETLCKDANTIVFGILPFVSAEQLVIQFSPIAIYLSDHLNVPVRIETAPNFAEFARRTHEDKRYDILFTAPHFYPKASSKAGYKLIVSVDSPGMWAVIVVPKKSSIHNINDLIGQRMATLPPAGLATLLVKKHLSDAGIDPDKDIIIVNTPSHDASLLSSYYGVTEASALMQPPYAAASQQVRESMRIIARTESTPHIPISVSPRLSQICGDEIKKLLLQMSSTKKGKKILSHNSFSGFKKTSRKDYEKMNEILKNK